MFNIIIDNILLFVDIWADMSVFQSKRRTIYWHSTLILETKTLHYEDATNVYITQTANHISVISAGTHTQAYVDISSVFDSTEAAAQVQLKPAAVQHLWLNSPLIQTQCRY